MIKTIDDIEFDWDLDFGWALRQLMVTYKTKNTDLMAFLKVSHPTIVTLRKNEDWNTLRVKQLAAFFGVKPSEITALAESEAK